MTPEHKAAIQEGKRRVREARAMAEANIANYGDSEAIEVARKEPERHAISVEVIYRPFDGDPHTTKWNGIVFRANVPVTLSKANHAHYIEQLLPKTVEGANGEAHTKHVTTKVFMGDLARTNPSFEVDGERAKKLVNKRVLPPAGHGWAEDHEDDISESTAIDASVAL